MKNKGRYCGKILVLALMMILGVAGRNVYASSNAPQKTIKILFIGNSHTYYNNMPAIFKELANADNINCEVSSVTASGYKLSKFADKNDKYGIQVYNLLAQYKWDYVVLQENRGILVESPTQAENAVKTLHSLIKKAGAKMVIYATQPNNVGCDFTINSTKLYLTDLQIEQILTKNNFKISNEYEGLIAPSGTNFMRVIQDFPEIKMYNADNLHPTVQGSYLAACTIYHTIFGKTPYGNQFLPNSEYDTGNLLKKMSVEEALILQQIADSRLTIDKHHITVNKGESLKLTGSFFVSSNNKLFFEKVEDETEKDQVSNDNENSNTSNSSQNNDNISSGNKNNLLDDFQENNNLNNDSNGENIYDKTDTPDIEDYNGLYLGYKNNILWNTTDLTGISINRVTGQFTALKTGKYQVMATTDSGLICYTTIDVKQPAKTLTIKETGILKVVKGYKGKYTASMTPSDTTDKVTWTSDYPDIVSVDSNGNIQAKKIGIAKITATTTSGIKTYRYVRVKLKSPAKITLTRKVKKANGKKSYSVKVKWTKNTNATKYYVYRKMAGKSTYKKIATTTKPQYIDTKVKKNKIYSYKIKAINANTKLNSDKSIAKSIKVNS